MTNDLEQIRHLDVVDLLYGASTESMMIRVLSRDPAIASIIDHLSGDDSARQRLLFEAVAALEDEQIHRRHPDEMAFVAVLYVLLQTERQLAVRLAGQIKKLPDHLFPWAHRFAEYTRSQTDIYTGANSASSSARYSPDEHPPPTDLKVSG